MKRTVALIEKDTSVQENLIKRIMLENDLEMKISTTSGFDGYQKFQATPTDIAVINLPLPDCDGVPLINAIKSAKKDVYIIVICDIEDQMLRVNLQSLGVTDILVKPVHLENLITILKSKAYTINRNKQEDVTSQSFGIGPFGIKPGNQQNPFENAFNGQSQNAKKEENNPFDNFSSSKNPFESAHEGQKEQPKSQEYENNPFVGGQFREQLRGQTQNNDNTQEIYQSHGGGFRTIKQQILTLNCPKGGVGKTTISTNIATGLSTVRIGKQPLKVLLVDMDLEFGDVCTTLGMQPHPSIMNWISDINAKLENSGDPNYIPQYTQAQIENYLISYKTGLKILAAPSNHSDIIDISDKVVQIIIDNLKNNSGFDIIIFDTGNNTSGYTLYSMSISSAVYEIVTMDVAAMNDLNMLLKTLRSLNFPINKMKMIINRMPKTDKEFSIQDISQALGLDVVGVIPETPKVRVANNEGEPLILGRDNEFTVSIKKIGNTMLGVNLFQQGRQPREKEKSGGFLSKLFKR